MEIQCAFGMSLFYFENEEQKKEYLKGYKGLSMNSWFGASKIFAFQNKKKILGNF